MNLRIYCRKKLLRTYLLSDFADYIQKFTHILFLSTSKKEVMRTSRKYVNVFSFAHFSKNVLRKFFRYDIGWDFTKSK